jgi:acetyl esterase
MNFLPIEDLVIQWMTRKARGTRGSHPLDDRRRQSESLAGTGLVNVYIKMSHMRHLNDESLGSCSTGQNPSRVGGHGAYYGVTFNHRMFSRLREEVKCVCLYWLNRANRARRRTWERFVALLKVFPLASKAMLRKNREIHRGFTHCSTMKHCFLAAIILSLALAPGAISADTSPRPAPAKKRAHYVDDLGATLKPAQLVTYKRVGNRELKLHVFLPSGWKASDQRPCFLTIHGGGWTGGVPTRMYPFASHFASLGMVGISVEYRLLKTGTDVTVFDCVKDGRSAVRYVRAHAAELGVDSQRIVGNGGSAGGHVVAGTAIFTAVNEAGENTRVSAEPNALVLLFPAVDTSAGGEGNPKIGPRWKELSPVHNVRPGLPPTLIFNGSADTSTPLEASQRFRAAMLKAGNRCDIDVHEGGVHGYLMFERSLFEDTLAKTEAFLRDLKFLPMK